MMKVMPETTNKTEESEKSSPLRRNLRKSVKKRDNDASNDDNIVDTSDEEVRDLSLGGFFCVSILLIN